MKIPKVVEAVLQQKLHINCGVIQSLNYWIEYTQDHPEDIFDINESLGYSKEFTTKWMKNEAPKIKLLIEKYSQEQREIKKFLRYNEPPKHPEYKWFKQRMLECEDQRRIKELAGLRKVSKEETLKNIIPPIYVREFYKLILKQHNRKQENLKKFKK